MSKKANIREWAKKHKIDHKKNKFKRHKVPYTLDGEILLQASYNEEGKLMGWHTMEEDVFEVKYHDSYVKYLNDTAGKDFEDILAEDYPDDPAMQNHVKHFKANKEEIEDLE